MAIEAVSGAIIGIALDSAENAYLYSILISAADENQARLSVQLSELKLPKEFEKRTAAWYQASSAIIAMPKAVPVQNILTVSVAVAASETSPLATENWRLHIQQGAHKAPAAAFKIHYDGTKSSGARAAESYPHKLEVHGSTLLSISEDYVNSFPMATKQANAGKVRACPEAWQFSDSEAMKRQRDSRRVLVTTANSEPYVVGVTGGLDTLSSTIAVWSLQDGVCAASRWLESANEVQLPRNAQMGAKYSSFATAAPLATQKQAPKSIVVPGYKEKAWSP